MLAAEMFRPPWPTPGVDPPRVWQPRSFPRGLRILGEQPFTQCEGEIGIAGVSDAEVKRLQALFPGI